MDNPLNFINSSSINVGFLGYECVDGNEPAASSSGRIRANNPVVGTGEKEYLQGYWWDGFRMTKVIKGEIEKLEDFMVKDVSLTCDTSLEVSNNEINRLCRMNDDLFTYEVEVTNILCDTNFDDDLVQQVSHEADDDMGYDPSDVAFTKWLGSKIFNYMTMDHCTMTALWIYWICGDDEVDLTDEESSDDENEVAEVFRINTNIFDFETPLCKTFNEFNYLLKVGPDLLTKDIEGFKTYNEYKDDWIYEWNRDVPWVDEKPWTNTGDYEWYESLNDSALKQEALLNKGIMEGLIDDVTPRKWRKLRNAT
ncbi:hypothetical protein Tco_0409309 [Tanacetum coccineum]